MITITITGIAMTMALTIITRLLSPRLISAMD
jgi:hypothetical protein